MKLTLKLSIAIYIISLCLPAISPLEYSAEHLTDGYETLILGPVQVLFGLVMLPQMPGLGLLLMLPWLANISWLISLVTYKEKLGRIAGLCTAVIVVVFFAHPVAIIGSSVSVVLLQLHIGAYLWMLALMLPLLTLYPLKTKKQPHTSAS
ncbi:hypothetical protein [Pseudoalteromonas sp. R3]|uniref:hypothetical protein n=1 Tax=Pseudoalteromonas sp. R3 TaxID=1709477 RepID=UPI0006B58CD7|nr:hypothetical protein [Pseudoalteromonas sp. R3]AZZ97830.1 hypothetical protein ELR70_12325 [Pseudoalteromonas sp. R3]